MNQIIDYIKNHKTTLKMTQDKYVRSVNFDSYELDTDHDGETILVLTVSLSGTGKWFVISDYLYEFKVDGEKFIYKNYLFEPTTWTGIHIGKDVITGVVEIKYEIPFKINVSNETSELKIAKLLDCVKFFIKNEFKSKIDEFDEYSNDSIKTDIMQRLIEEYRYSFNKDGELE